MKNIIKLMSVALLLLISSTANLLSESVTFINNLPVTATLTGPRGSKNINSNESGSIKPIMNPVNYSIEADGYGKFEGSATNGVSYLIDCDENKNIIVSEKSQTN